MTADAQDQELPSAAELQEAQQVLQQLQHTIAQIEAAPTQPETADVADDEVPATQANGAADGNAKVLKKRAAVFLAYQGHGFSGMQLNPGVPTIEAYLRDALVASGAISEENRHKLAALRWSRSARTDKGVSALGQVVAAKLLLVDDIVQRTQAHLPAKIKLLGVRRVTNGFDARTNCDSRVYEYALPVWVFDPDCFPLQPGWRPQCYPADAAIQAGNPAPSDASAHHLAEGVQLKAGYSLTKPPQQSAFVFNDECQSRMSSILAQYEGSHNFHNFSPGVQPEQMSAQRHILSFRCTGTFTITSSGHTAPWVRLRAHGQSFLLHQIRKMVGMAVAVYRGCAPIDAIHLALDPCCDFSTPMAPELGLFLCESKFDTYNDKFGNDRERLDIHEWDAEAARFRDEHIYPSLLERDDAEAVNYQWLQTVSDQRFFFSTWRDAKPVRKLKRPRNSIAAPDAVDV